MQIARSGETVHFDDAFLPGATLLFRCTDIGVYQFRGSHTMICEQSMWAGIPPKCTRLPLAVHGMAPIGIEPCFSKVNPYILRQE
jgi:hypothetical protein